MHGRNGSTSSSGPQQVSPEAGGSHISYESFASEGYPEAEEQTPLLKRLFAPRLPGIPHRIDEGVAQETGPNAAQKLSVKDIFLLTVGLSGTEMMWTLEMTYGTPFLLSLGLSKYGATLVWLGGPISGFVVQPLIGMLSDATHSRYRRRKFIIGGLVVCVTGAVSLAYCKTVARVILSIYGLGDWDPRRQSVLGVVTIIVAIVSFWLLDFALNAVQASVRNLMNDKSPREQKSAIGAWHGFMLHGGHILTGYLGYQDLTQWACLRWTQGEQFQRLTVLTAFLLVAVLLPTLVTQNEAQIKMDETFSQGKPLGIFALLRQFIGILKHIPVNLRKVLTVQVFSWLGWFPVMLYGSTFIAEAAYAEAIKNGEDPGLDYLEREGSLGIMYFSVVALISSVILPLLGSLAARIENESTLKKCFTLESFWGGSSLFLSIIIWSSVFLSSLHGALAILALTGISWAVTTWVPFAFVMDAIHEQEESQQKAQARSEQNARGESSSRTRSERRGQKNANRARSRNESQQSLRERSRRHPLSYESFEPNAISEELDEVRIDMQKSLPKETSGTFMGVHNTSIVFAQLLSAFMSSAILASMEGPQDGIGLHGSNEVVWAMRIGGLFSIAAGIAAFRLRQRS